MTTKIKTIKINDKEYPENLRKIYDPPQQLYCCGNIELLQVNNKIAIIGSRDYSKYGKDIATQFAYTRIKT